LGAFNQQLEEIKNQQNLIQNSEPTLANMFKMQMEMYRYSHLQEAIQQIETILNLR
jgi:hypothetical protein